MRVDELNCLSDVASLRDEWRTLLDQTVGATFFQSLEWLETYWRHFGSQQALRVLVVREGDDPIGIVPLTVLRENVKFGAVRILTYPLAYWGSHYGPIGPRPADCLRAALAHVLRTRRTWDLLDLRFAPRIEADAATSVSVMAECGVAPLSKVVDHTSCIDLPPTLEGYFSGRTSKWRNNYKRWFRRLEERGRLRYARYRPEGEATGDTDPWWALYDDCEKVAEASWQGQSTDGTTLTHAAVRPFLRDMHATACRAGTADINLLYLDERPLAFLYCYRRGNGVFGLRTGFDESLASDGVGNIMYLHVVEDSIRRGDKMLDLGPGSLEAKRALATRVEPIFRHTWANPFSLRGMAWRMKHALKGPQLAERGALSAT